MNTKTLLAAALLLVLASCSNNQAPEAGESANTENATEADAKPAAPGSGPASQYIAFETVVACVEAGWPQSQCDRAWGTADAMARVDAPAYPHQAGCEKLWKSCEAVKRGEAAGWMPRVMAFAISGEEKGDAGPTAQNPAFYVPIFATLDGRFVHVTGTPENPAMTAIDAEKIVKATRAAGAQSADATQPVSR